MELFPHRVSKAVYVAAAMLTSGQRTLDMFSQKADSNDLMRQAQIFLYANGNTQPPTAINLDKSLLRDLLFNQSPAKAGAIFLKLTEEKNRVLQQNDKLRQELELLRHGHTKSSGEVNLLYIVLVGLIGILMRYFMRKS